MSRQTRNQLASLRSIGFFLAVAMGTFLGSCTQYASSDSSRYYNDGRTRPLVAVIPVMDNSHNDLSWSLSEELTEALSLRLSHKNKLLLVHPEKIAQATRGLSSANDPFNTQIQWMKKAFAEEEFLVFTEVLEHEEVPVANKDMENSSAQLHLKMRVRIVDVRGKSPRVVLQELLDESYYIPKNFTKAHFTQVPWTSSKEGEKGKEGYAISPLGMAHAQLTKKIAAQIEEYILLAKSK